MATVDIPGSGIPGVRNITSWRKGREMSELGPNISKPPRNVEFDAAGKIIRDSEASLGRRIISKFGDIWTGVKPHLDSLVDGVRAAFASPRGGIVGLILGGIAAIAIGAYNIFSGGASTIARSIAPVSRIASRYGLGGKGTPVTEGIMTPVDDIPLKSSRSLASGRFSLGMLKRLRPLLGPAAALIAGWQMIDQMKRDRQTEAFQDMPMFRHSADQDNIIKQIAGEIAGWIGLNTGWNEKTQFDLMANTALGGGVGMATAPMGFLPAAAGQFFQEGQQTQNNIATGQPAFTGTLLDLFVDPAKWMWDKMGGGSATQVTVNFADGRQENVSLDANAQPVKVQTTNGSTVLISNAQSTTNSLINSVPTSTRTISDTTDPGVG